MRGTSSEIAKDITLVKARASNERPSSLAYHNIILRSAVASLILLVLAGPIAMTARLRRFPESFTLKVGRPALKHAQPSAVLGVH